MFHKCFNYLLYNNIIIYFYFKAETGPVLAHRRSWIENTNLSMKGSFTDLSNLDLDSDNSTPAMQRVSVIKTIIIYLN